MQMDGWTDHLHIGLFGEHVLFPSLRLDSGWHFIVACLFTTVLCLVERCVSGPLHDGLSSAKLRHCPPSALTYTINKHWAPFAWTRRSRLGRALWKSMLYWVVTFDRLCVSIPFE